MPNVNDIKIDKLPQIRDARGTLVVAEFGKFVPFPVVRVFYVCDVPSNTARGQHAHRQCRQYMICQAGRVLLEVADGARMRRIELSAGQAVLVEQRIFASETFLDPNTVLLVLCDKPYDSNDYIRSIEDLTVISRETD